MTKKERLVRVLAPVFLMGVFSGCWGGGGSSSIVVNSLEDVIDPPAGMMTIRDAMERIDSGGTITFDPVLNGGVIDLEIIAAEHSTLRGEVFILVFDPMPPHWVFEGFLERDYGASALYANKDLTIDASGLPDGITLNWTGGGTNPARVLAVYGDLTMANVNISAGVASAVFLTTTFGEQNHTLARGAGVAVWGVGILSDCEISGNRALGDTDPGRDRGAFGGGVYGDVLILEDCVVAGNSVSGYGAGGGGIYSVGGAGHGGQSSLTRCAVTGNRIAGQHAYGGGIYSDGGGQGNMRTISLANTTVARNLVMDHPDIETDEFYYRGGGLYMSNGILSLQSCTIAENEVTGYAATFHGEPNMSGGGVAATVGDAHVVENMQVRHSIIAGNTVDGAPGDLFTGSLIDFYSWGYNLIGELNFDYIHVPVTWWADPGYLSRKHYPKEGDQDGVDVADVLSVGDARLHPSIESVGAAMGQSTVLWYPPVGAAVNTIPTDEYQVSYVRAGCGYSQVTYDDFLVYALDQVNTVYSLDYSSAFGTLEGITFHGPAYTWPDTEEHPENIEWITFWRDLDTAIGDSLGTGKLADDFWETADTGPLGDNIDIVVDAEFEVPIGLIGTDQLGNARPIGALGDIGAIEAQ